jgi:hypothetical protein
MEENTTPWREFPTTFYADRGQTPIDAFDALNYIRGWLQCDSLSSWMMAPSARAAASSEAAEGPAWTRLVASTVGTVEGMSWIELTRNGAS